MFQALPVIIGAVSGGLRDLRGGSGAGQRPADRARLADDGGRRRQRHPGRRSWPRMPQLGLGLILTGFAGAFMIVVFGFLFVTVSARLTGEIGSSSNPISGMTVATLLLTCLIMLGLDGLGLITISKEIKLTALMIAGVVCIASSNGGSTAQALKTGHLLGATPKFQQIRHPDRGLDLRRGRRARPARISIEPGPRTRRKTCRPSTIDVARSRRRTTFAAASTPATRPSTTS